MRIKELTAAAAALVMSSVPAMAQAVERAAAPAQGSSLFGEGSALLTILVIVALGVGIYLLVDDDGSDSP